MAPQATLRFPIRFGRAYRILSTALLIAPSDSYVELEGDEVRVRMAWIFRTRFPRASVVAASRYRGRPLSRGVHGFAGRWLVNGSGQGIVSLRLTPPPRAWSLVFPLRLSELLVSLEDPEGLLAALGRPPAGPSRAD